MNKKLLLLIGLLILIGGASMADTSVIDKLAAAIANAEGANVEGSRPKRNNNPGNLTLDITKRGIGKDGIYVIYNTFADGLDALRKQVDLMFGGSSIYNPSMTIREVAEHYTTTQKDAWANNVASYLGVTPGTRLDELT
jgi:hypothetical protein